MWWALESSSWKFKEGGPWQNSKRKLEGIGLAGAFLRRLASYWLFWLSDKLPSLKFRCRPYCDSSNLGLPLINLWEIWVCIQPWAYLQGVLCQTFIRIQFEIFCEVISRFMGRDFHIWKKNVFPDNTFCFEGNVEMAPFLSNLQRHFLWKGKSSVLEFPARSLVCCWTGIVFFANNMGLLLF